MRKWLILLFLCPCVMRGQTQPATEALDKLANDFWSWRAKYAPFTADDVNRLERPGGVREWSAAAIDRRIRDLKEFDARYQKIDPSGWPIPQQVDYRLIGSALSRVHWELEVNPRWKRDPNFYIEQTLTPIAEALTVPAPYDEARSREILTRIENVPSTLQQAAENLDKTPGPFMTVAVQALEGARERLRKMAESLRLVTTLAEKELSEETNRAADALEHFHTNLNDRLASAPKKRPSVATPMSSFLKTSRSIPTRPNKFWKWGSRNGIAQLRLKRTRKSATKTFRRSNSRRIPIAG